MTAYTFDRYGNVKPVQVSAKFVHRLSDFSRPSVEYTKSDLDWFRGPIRETR